MKMVLILSFEFLYRICENFSQTNFANGIQRFWGVGMKLILGGFPMFYPMFYPMFFRCFSDVFGQPAPKGRYSVTS